MAATAPVGSLFAGDDTLEPQRRPGYRKLGFWNGLFIGLALALGSWGLEAWRLTTIPSPQGSTSVLLSGFIVVAVCAFTGWLTARLAQGWLTVLMWFAVGVTAALFIGYQPYIGQYAGRLVGGQPFLGH